MPLMAIVLLMVAAMLVVAVRVSDRLYASARARTAADAAALAGAAAGEAEARALAAANGGELVGYSQVGSVVVVQVKVGPAVSEAWAESVFRWDLPADPPVRPTGGAPTG